MGLPTDFINGGNLPFICVGRGGKTDQFPDTTLSGRTQNKSPLLHGERVPLDHVPLTGGSQPPTGGNQCTFAGVPDYGTFTYFEHDTGTLNGKSAGIPYGAVNNADSGTPGNFGLLQQFLGFFSKQDGRNRPPNYKETQRDGATVRPPDEKGPWNYNLTQGIPTHAAMSTVSGIRIPKIGNVPTAIQAFSSIMTGGMLGNLPGAMMTIGQIISSIMNNSQKRAQVTQNMSPQMVNAMTSIAALSQTGNAIDSGGYTTGIRVNPDVFSNNAVEMLSQCDSVADVLACTEELSSNTAYHGMDAYANTKYETVTPFGNTAITVTPSGQVVNSTSNQTQQAIQAFTSLMSSASSFQSMLTGRNLFGESSGTMFNMLNRLPPGAMAAAQAMLNKTNPGEGVNKTVRERTAKGGNPLQPGSTYQEAGSGGGTFA